MNRVYLALGMPGEVQSVGLAGYRQYEGESVMIHHIVPHIVQLSIQTCEHTKELISTETHGEGTGAKIVKTIKKTKNKTDLHDLLSILHTKYVLWPSTTRGPCAFCISPQKKKK